MPPRLGRSIKVVPAAQEDADDIALSAVDAASPTSLQRVPQSKTSLSSLMMHGNEDEPTPQPSFGSTATITQTIKTLMQEENGQHRRVPKDPVKGMLLRDALAVGHGKFPKVNPKLKCSDLLGQAFLFPSHEYDSDPSSCFKTGCFGTVKFQATANHRASYLRLGHRLNPKSPVSLDLDENPALAAVATIHSLQVAHYGTHFRPPTLIISVTGGAKSFALPKRLKDTVHNGLLRAAEKSHAWVVTGGSNSGVMQLTGSILSKFHSTSRTYSPPLIGIATWGILAEREKLAAGSLDVEYMASKFNHLDPNHTHFLLVDDGSDEQFGREIVFRGQFEQEAARVYDCPAVTIVVQGGPGTLKTAIASVEVKHPLVVIDGSGLVADLIAYAYNFLHSSNVRYSKYSLDGLKRMIQRMFPAHNRNALLDDVLRCVQIPALVVIYNLQDDNGAPIDEAILKAVFHNQGHLSNKLKQAILFDRIDVAREALQAADYSRIQQSDDAATLAFTLSDNLMFALLSNKPQFVQLLLDFGAKVSKLKPTASFRHLMENSEMSLPFSKSPSWDQAICELYFDSAFGRDTHIQKLVTFSSCVQSHQSPNPNSQTLRFDYNLYAPCHMEELLLNIAGKEFWLKRSDRNAKTASEAENEIIASHTLFIWAVCVNNFRIARLFWKNANDSIANALLASRILVQLSKNSALEGPHLADERHKMKHNSLKFQDLATGVLEMCHTSDTEKTAQLLHQDVHLIERTNAMELARMCNAKSFIAHPSTQAVIDRDWFRNAKDVTAIGYLPHAVWVVCAIFLFFLFIPIRAIFYKRSGVIDPVSYWKRLAHTAIDFFVPPCTRFLLDVLSYVSLCSLFSFMVLVDYKQGTFNILGDGQSLTEYIVLVWMIVLFLEEVRQFVDQGDGLVGYFKDQWNFVDILNIGLYAFGFFIRRSDLENPATQVSSKTVFSFVAIGLILRGIRYYSALEFLGPKMIMVRKMMKDVWAFVLLLGLFLIAYGVAAQSIMFPLRAADYQTLENVFFRPYFLIYGELFLEEYQEESACTGPWQFSSCTWKNTWLIPALLVFYLIVTNILLVNLLIAMFNDTYMSVKESATILWRNQNYDLLLEFRAKPIVPPPFSIVAMPYLFFVRNRTSRGRSNSDSSAQDFQELHTDRFWDHHIQQDTDEAMDFMLLRSDQANAKLSALQNTLLQLAHAFEASVGTHVNALPTETSEDVHYLGTSNSAPNLALIKGRGSMLLDVQLFNPASGDCVYPGIGATNYATCQKRFALDNSQVSWKVPLPMYSPPEWSSDSSVCAFRDPIIPPRPRTFDLPERHSHVKQPQDAPATPPRGYHIIGGVPINPFGRTGMCGLGVLPQWGPCLSVDLLIARWRRDSSGVILRRGSKRVAEFLAIKRRGGGWSFPGTFVRPGETAYAAAWRLMFTEVMRTTTVPPVGSRDTDAGELMSVMLESVATRAANTQAVYSWDPRNTDNAWVETQCFTIFDPDGVLTNDLTLPQGSDATSARWTMMLHRWKLFASHTQFLQQVADALDCAF
eukprot:m.93692 g.93692  ORF g.93692 m.93692 type:complete len:1531 (-) comp13006_c0_seq1:106-4698(-)